MSVPSARLSGLLSIVAIYDGFEDGIRVHEALDWLDLTLGPNLVIHHCALSFAMLGRLDIRAAAVHEASVADVLMVAAQPDKPLPLQVTRWIERCFSENRHCPATLVGLHDDPSGQNCGLNDELSRISRRWNLEYISNRDFDQRMNANAVGDLLHRLGHDFEGSYDFLTPSPSHYGGLNE